MTSIKGRNFGPNGLTLIHYPPEVQSFYRGHKVLTLGLYYIPRRKSGIYWIQVRRAAAAAVEISLWTR